MKLLEFIFPSLEQRVLKQKLAEKIAQAERDILPTYPQVKSFLDLCKDICDAR